MEWKPWLVRWSDEWVRSADPSGLDAEVARERWLGFGPATGEAVAAAEARIGRVLPPSYREFLLTTDGWRYAGEFVWRMCDTSNIGWLRDLEPHWEESYMLDEDDDFGDDTEPDPANGNEFSRGLLISAEADSGILFLDPGDIDESGEWAAYSLFSWKASPPERFESFTALMEDLYAEFHQMRKPEGETRDRWDATVEQARLDALAGDFDSAAAALKEAEDFGRDRAALLRVQLLLFLGKDYEASGLLGRLLHASFTPAGLLTDPLFTEELMPLLYAQHAEQKQEARSSVLELAMIGGRPEIPNAISAYEARLPDNPPNYGNPAFDTLIRRARHEHATNPDALWDAVRAALSHWQPRSADHLAPISLLADPVLAAVLTPERGRELLSQPRSDR